MYAVFAGRLIPGVAFDVISYAAGLTRMRFRNFIVATALGIFPQTFLYSYLGRQAPEYVALFLVTSALVVRSEEHTSELQSRQYLVCRLLLEKKKKQQTY